jgi:hypothetical protein
LEQGGSFLSAKSSEFSIANELSQRSGINRKLLDQVNGID